MANVVKNIGNSIKSVIGRFLATDDDNEEHDIRATLVDECSKGKIDETNAKILAVAFKKAEDAGKEYQESQGSSGKKLKSSKKYTSHKDDKTVPQGGKDRGRERERE